MKKVFATLLALALALTLCASAMAATITINPNVPEGATGGNQTYTAYKIFDATISGENVSYTIDTTNPFFETINGNEQYFELDRVNETNTYIVKVKNAFNEDAAKALAAQLEAVEGKVAAGAATTLNAEGKYVIDGLADGYYLVTSTVGSALILDTFAVTEVTEKNEYPSLEKTVDATTADMGAIVTFTITVNIPATAEGQIVVHDKMEGLEYQGMTEIEGVTAITEGLEDGCTVHFELSETLVQKNRGETVVIEYTAKVTADTANNEAFLENNDFESKPGTVEIKNYKFDVYKYEEVGGQPQGLAGAGFVLKNKDGNYYKFDAEKNEVSWVVNINDATELKPDAGNGYTVTFAGLANGTYTLIEKTVPAGYNPAANTQVVIADEDAVKVNVLNATGSELPSTGGIGTTIFYVVGGLMMFGALVLLITKKKVSAK